MTLLQSSTWHGMPAWALENDTLRTVIVPEMGAKLVSLFDKRTGCEWLVGPGSRPFQKVAYGAAFEQQDMSGWDEMFPTIVACGYPGPGARHGVALPDHGEVWALPWQVQQASDGRLVLQVQGQALPYRLQRTAEYSAADVLQLHYQVWNLGEEALPFVWAAHPQFASGAGATVILPAHISEVCNTIPAEWGWGAPETRFSWPVATAVDGTIVDLDQVGPPTLRQARKFFALPEARLAWCGVVRQPSLDWLRLAWAVEAVPYFGLWVDEGAISVESVVAPEPTTGFYDSLATAWAKDQVTQLGPGESHTWSLTVRLGTAEQPFPAQAKGKTR